MSETKPIIELELYLVRHGQSHGNAGTSGDTVRERTDPELTQAGVEQTELLGERFAHLPLDAVFSSGLVRAMSTAQAVVEHQPESGAKTFEIDPIFTEVGCNAEEYRGIDAQELGSRFPQAVFPGGELLFSSKSGDDPAAYARAKAAADYLRGRFHSGEKVLVAAHAAFNTFLVFALLNIDISTSIFDLNFNNTGVTKIVVYSKGSGLYGDDIHLIYCNDMSHLYHHNPHIVFENRFV